MIRSTFAQIFVFTLAEFGTLLVAPPLGVALLLAAGLVLVGHRRQRA